MISFLVAIHRACNLTFTRYGHLKRFFNDDWERVWKSHISEWQKAGIDVRAIKSFFANRDKISPEKEVSLLQKCGAQILFCDAPEYPLHLRQIHNPPVLLFCRGDLQADDFPSVSVVGSRKLSRYGQRAAELIVGQLADSGVTIISGLAFGADLVAHRIALEHGSRTIAVLGNGIDTIYPATNKSFAERFISEHRGAILSEYLPGTECRPENFPTRNRLVSGLSRATIILEAATKSGSLITAELAIQQNRDLFAVPGEIFSKNSEGCNHLISIGNAAPALSGESILQTLSFHNLASKKSAKRALPATQNENLVLNIFDDHNELHIDEVLRLANLPKTVASSVVSILEIKGLLKNLGNQTYVRTL